MGMIAFFPEDIELTLSCVAFLLLAVTIHGALSLRAPYWLEHLANVVTTIAAITVAVAIFWQQQPDGVTLNCVSVALLIVFFFQFLTLRKPGPRRIRATLIAAFAAAVTLGTWLAGLA